MDPRLLRGYVHGYLISGEKKNDVRYVEFDNELGQFIDRDALETQVQIQLPANQIQEGGTLFVEEILLQFVTGFDGQVIGSISRKPLGDVLVTVNGISVMVATGESDKDTSACYITSPGSDQAKDTFEAGDEIRWVGSVAGYELELDDEVKLIYSV